MYNDRLAILIGENGIQKLNNATVAVFGIGGVGSYAVEALARSGVGNLLLVDDDVYSETNLNRQLYATLSTIGKSKAECAANRVADINPSSNCIIRNERFTPENACSFDFAEFDFVIDAIDSLDCKCALIKACNEFEIPVISSMGAGNRLRADLFKVGDVFSVTGDPLAKALRQRLRKENITSLKCVYSTEEPKASRPIGSICHVTATAGMMLASEAINYLLK